MEPFRPDTRVMSARRHAMGASRHADFALGTVWKGAGSSSGSAGVGVGSGSGDAGAGARGRRPGGRVVRVTPLGVVTCRVPSGSMTNRQPGAKVFTQWWDRHRQHR